MLKQLIINNIVLIDKAEIDFSPKLLKSEDCSNLCILSGETGSGKSILLDALGLAIGFRSSGRLIGEFDSKAAVIAEFEIGDNLACKKILIENQLLDEENPSQLRIRRLVFENSVGKTSKILGKVFVNDNPIGVNLLAKIGETLVEIHGQHEQRGLLVPSTHLQLLDEFSGNDDLLFALSRTYSQLCEIDAKIYEYHAKKSQIEREKDYLTHVVRELGDAAIEIGEEEKLVAAKDLLAAKEKILNFATEFKNKLVEASSAMLQAQKTLMRNQSLIENFLQPHQPDFSKVSDKNDSQIDELEHSISWLESLIRDTRGHNENREEIEERLFLIRSLARKFNTTTEGLPKILEESQAKLVLLEQQEQLSCEFLVQKNSLLCDYQETATQLTKKRREAAIVLAQKVEAELKFLKMPSCKFHVELITVNSSSNHDSLGKNEDEFMFNQDFVEKASITKADNFLVGDDGKSWPAKNYFANGNEKACFTAAINNNNFDEITKIASGGELSRFMLALKVALMGVKSVPVMIFDEIDTGIGGATADAVGKRLKTLAQHLQILVVTHQPQIAAKANLHLKVSKVAGKTNANLACDQNGENAENLSRTVIETLNENQSLNEIARMISGDVITDDALRAAKSLITG